MKNFKDSTDTKTLINTSHMVITSDQTFWGRCDLTRLLADCLSVEFHLGKKIQRRQINRDDAVDIINAVYEGGQS